MRGEQRGGKCKGLVSYDRNLRKDSFYYYKAQWASEPFVHINSRRYAQRVADSMTVRIYTNQPHVTLEVDGAFFAEQDGQTVFVFEEVPLHAGENTMTAHVGNCTDTVTWTRVDTTNPDYTYVDPNPGFNVKNWFTPGQGEGGLFPEDRFSLMDSIGNLMDNPQAAELIETYLPQLKNNTVMKVANNVLPFRNIKPYEQLFRRGHGAGAQPKAYRASQGKAWPTGIFFAVNLETDNISRQGYSIKRSLPPAKCRR